jgi:hypothetical protein
MMTGNTTSFGVRRGVGPPRHPSRLHCAGSALPKMPNRRRFGLQEGGHPANAGLIVSTRAGYILLWLNHEE